MEFFEGAIETISNLIIGEQGTKGEWDKDNRYMSFVHERKNCHVKWYVDAKDYFYAVSEALMSAKEEILIEDLWLSPELVCGISIQNFSLTFFSNLSWRRTRDNLIIDFFLQFSIFVDLLPRMKNIALTVYLKRKQKKE